ncbi:hypothetical protein OPV22_007596 [Ensete ventricosum]|uniref:RBR-type E3 ubiquitin transferase n=1 Tax=Ensete ventricosum TaxID=4639 RepID=A0AAV8RHL3_ENSVE|nr:hypothetical protein OPV22_007596 [Ensete ventricosum]
MDEEDYYFGESDGDDGGSSYSLEGDDGDDLNDLLVEEPVDISTTASVISTESLLAAQKDVLRNVMDLLLVSEQQARSLLIYYRWNVQKVYDSFERKGKERLFQDVGVVISDSRDLDISGSSTAVITCNICFEDVAVLDATKMDCGHLFCNDCWTQNFIIRIKDGERTIRCMDTKCNAICDDVIIRNLVSQKDPCLAERFERFLLESYVEDNDNIKWCPGTPHCGNAIRVDGSNVFEVECDKMTPEKQMKQHLFEDLQQQLETNVERLSMYIEKDFYDFNYQQVIELRFQVVNLNRVVNTFCGQIYKYIEDDLLEPMKHAVHRIAPYGSGGPKMLLRPSSSGNSGDN